MDVYAEQEKALTIQRFEMNLQKKFGRGILQ